MIIALIPTICILVLGYLLLGRPEEGSTQGLPPEDYTFCHLDPDGFRITIKKTTDDA